MGKGVFRKIIKSHIDVERPEKKTARVSGAEFFEREAQEQVAQVRALAAEVDAQKKADAPEASKDASPAKDAKAPSAQSVVIYGDVEVCRLLKIRRRKIAEARTKKARGIDWDCVGRHAGMTMKWIHEVALQQGIVPDFFGEALHPIQEGDGVVSCKLIGTWPNRTRVTVEVVATGEVTVATVRDAAAFHLFDIFDARDYGKEIAWAAELNNAIY